MNDLDPKTEARVEVITNALRHLPIRGKELQFAARQIDMALMQAGHISAVPDGEGELVERLRKDADALDAFGSNDFSDTIREAASRLSQAGVRVKPLEWHKSHMPSWNDDWHTTTPFIYSIRCADENGWKWSAHGGCGYASTPDGAKAAAQADYETRIRSALSGDTL